MKKWTKSVLVTVLSAVFLLGCMGTAWARNNDSNFADADGDAATGVTYFNLIKDYNSAYATSGAPYSKSPAETFTYTITPYHVWNAGSTFSSGTATQITTANMLMLLEPTSHGTDVTYTTGSGTGENRSLIVKQTVSENMAQYSTTTDYTNDTKTRIDLPDYTTVGDYWYQVVESKGENGNNRTTGVIYGSNDAVPIILSQENAAHNATYYIHVQVTEKGTTPTGTPNLVKNVTLHKNAPSKNYSNEEYNISTTTTYAANKAQAIVNTYYAGELQVKKVVSGNSGDKSNYFKIRVTFTKPAGTVVNSDIEIHEAYTLSGSTYSNSATLTIHGQYANASTPADADFKWDKIANSTEEAKAVAVFYVKDNTTVSFRNIPFGINYTVEEYSTGDLGYSNSFEVTRDDTSSLTYSFNGNNPALKTDQAIDANSHFYDDDSTTTILDTNVGAQGSITSSAADLVTITNSKERTIDIGVITENAPYIALLAVSGAALFLLFLRKKNPSEV